MVEQNVIDLMRAGISVDLICATNGSAVGQVGVRMRTFGKNLPKNKMVLGTADTFSGALDDAITKASGGRWEMLDWAARPWETPVADTSTSRFGL